MTNRLHVTARLTAGVLILALAAPTLALGATRTRLIASPSPSVPGEPVRLTAEVDGLGGGAPTGSVFFFDGPTQIGASTVTARGAGQATLTAGGFHSCALTKTGGVKCWGLNSLGQLGDGTTTERHTPVAVTGLSSHVMAVTSGAAHSCALVAGGSVRCWGANLNGQLGDGTTANRSAPVTVARLSGVVAIAAGAYHTCALTALGSVRCWGYNISGQLGDGTTIDRHAPVASLGLSSGVVAIAAGGDNACALTKLGAVKCWGNNVAGQIGDGTSTERHSPTDVVGLASGAVALATGQFHSCAIVGGGLKCWGFNGSGQLGDATTVSRQQPVAVVNLARHGVVAVTAGDNHTCALSGVGAVLCWGDNAKGQLADGTTTSRPSPVIVVPPSAGVVALAAGGQHSCALSRLGALKCAGMNGSGQIGDGSAGSIATHFKTTIDFEGLVRARARMTISTLPIGLHNLQAGYEGAALQDLSIGSFKHRVQ